jgi:hypothetical protein
MEETRIDLQLEKAFPCYKTYLAWRVFCNCTSVVGATVKVMDRDFNPLYHTTTNHSGTYAFNNTIPPGDYLVMAVSENCITSKAKSVLIESNHVCNVNFHLRENLLQKNAVVYGTLFDSSNLKKLDNVRIKLIEKCSKKTYACTQTNESGEYLIYDIDPGSYFLCAQHENYLSYCSQINLDTSQQYKIDILLIRDPKKACGTINGVIKYKNCSVHHIPVFLCTESKENSYDIVQMQFTNKRGVYLFTDVPPGQYVIKCKAQDGKAMSYTSMQIP